MRSSGATIDTAGSTRHLRSATKSMNMPLASHMMPLSRAASTKFKGVTAATAREGTPTIA